MTQDEVKRMMGVIIRCAEEAGKRDLFYLDVYKSTIQGLQRLTTDDMFISDVSMELFKPRE